VTWVSVLFSPSEVLAGFIAEPDAFIPLANLTLVPSSKYLYPQPNMVPCGKHCFECWQIIFINIEVTHGANYHIRTQWQDQLLGHFKHAVSSFNRENTTVCPSPCLMCFLTWKDDSTIIYVVTERWQGTRQWKWCFPFAGCSLHLAVPKNRQANLQHILSK